MVRLLMSKFIVVLICVSTILILTACGSKSVEPTPTPILPTSTPIPEQTVAPDVAFVQWLTEHGYEYQEMYDDGSLAYQRPSSEVFWLHTWPDNVRVVFSANPKVIPGGMLEATEVIIGAIESYNMDPTPLREAMKKLFQFPAMLQSDDYFVLIEEDDFYSVSYQITFRRK